MPTNLRQLRRLVLLRQGESVADRELLKLLVDQRDEAAFEHLVRRHGPMVLGVCQRILQNSHDAEDAFQATFLVFSRKASAIRKADSLVSWLYGVACRTAWKARAARGKQRAREQAMRDVGVKERQGAVTDELLDVLDVELERLPDIYRLPIIHCDLGGKTGKEAARLLGCPEGTLSARLTRGRRLLAERLTNRGVTLACGGAAVLSQVRTGAVPPTLIATTLQAANAFLLGISSGASALPPAVAQLTNGVLKSMLLSRLKQVAVLLLVVSGACGGAAVWVRYVAAVEAAAESPDTGRQPVTAARDKSNVAEDDLLAKMALRITIDGFEPNTPLKEALGFLAVRYGAELDVDSQLFKQTGIKEVGVQPVELPKIVHAQLAAVLRKLAAQANGVWVIGNGKLLLVPRQEKLVKDVQAQGYQLLPPAPANEDVELRAFPLVIDANNKLFQGTRSGIAKGAYEFEAGEGKAHHKNHARFTLHFDHRRYHFAFHFQDELGKAKPFRWIIVRDGSATYQSFIDTAKPENCECFVWPLDRAAAKSGYAQGLRIPWDLSQLMRGPVDISDWIARVPVAPEELPSGGFRFSFRDSKARLTCQAVPQFGWNVSRCELHHNDEEAPWEMQASWKESKVGWYLTRLEAKRGQQRFLFRIEEYQAGAPIAPTLFRLATLELPDGAHIIDGRDESRNWLYRYHPINDGDRSKYFDMEAELESLPSLGGRFQQ